MEILIYIDFECNEKKTICDDPDTLYYDFPFGVHRLFTILLNAPEVFALYKRKKKKKEVIEVI